MNRIRVLAVILFLFSGSSFLDAQEVLYLSLDSAQQYALEYNKTLKNAELAVDEAQKQVWQTLAGGLPQVDATVDYSNFLGYSIELRFNESMPATKIESKPTSNLNVSLGQLIFSGSYIVGLQTAKIYKSLSEKNYMKTGMDIKKLVISSYYNILVAEKLKDSYTKNLQNVYDALDKTQAMYQAGILEVTDVDQLSVQVTQIENAVKSAERQIELAYNLLRLQLGVDGNTKILLTESLDKVMEKQDFNATIVQPFNLNENIDYQLMGKQEEISEKQVTLEKMGYLPTISGFYNYTYKFLTTNFDMTPPNMVGLNLSLPIFSSGMRKAKLDQARIQYETTLNNKSLLEDQLLMAEKQYRFNLSTALEQYESQEKNVEVAKRVYHNIFLKYQQGMVSSLDLTTANNNYLQAENNYINALMQVLQAQLELDRLLNKI
ncbi:MAG: TolC family protein [Bacteroidales bacterium]|nr:TolC family protein [Bacteroidales bacterium]